MERVAVIIVAGGSGRRMGEGLPKQFRFLGNLPVLARTIGLFADALPGAEIVVVLPEGHISFWKDLAARFDVAGHRVVAGGAERFDSVRCGLKALTGDPELIAVQDGVRPLGTAEMIRRVVRAAAEHGAAIPVVEPVDSFRETDSAGNSHPVDRSRLRCVQTPQVFRADVLRNAYAAEFRPAFTDDASVVEAAGHPVCLVPGERGNIKLTAPEDFIVAEALLTAREEAEAAGADEAAGANGREARHAE
ncbi:2-C-methyl-D-erythritol 4-phosphate cytidylyltransferase [Alistipes sp. An66]|uniref:2-C-methyl-D-erythritol 4-phosphate cytidylyltransferase n=1 Tax=Alistipes sp. An66 TaxID=1965650 RepID=UPI000B3A5D7A|nr:2-C-methyl-D-erythritol 4-phosphate cytidylyltransferase [Alistipes sp. An66]OUN59787.1 2-C-methyl-D-erythritol 4-phosphate cytidylyltransferase [Alistipes sp. An66]